jgi:hypothetical protein
MKNDMRVSDSDQSGMNQLDKERSEIVVRKAEKLTTATYMVSDIIPDREPIKWKMRETSIDLLSDITLSATASSSERLAYLRGVTKRIEKMLSFLDIANATRMLSEMNVRILREEYAALARDVEVLLRDLLSGALPRASALPPMYRRDRQSERREVAQSDRAPERSAEHPHSSSSFSADRISASARESEPRLPSSPASPLPVSSQSGTSFVPHTPETNASSRPTPPPLGDRDSRIGREDRRKIILALLKQRSRLTVKDIAKSIPGFSEKTIQRELAAMLVDRLVIKEGEKRWTTYSLIS